MKHFFAAVAGIAFFSCLPQQQRFYPAQKASERFQEITVSTVDYAGGALIQGAAVTVFDEEGNSVAVFENKEGSFVFRPEKRGVYSLQAGGGDSGRAISRCSGVAIPSVFSTVELRLPESVLPSTPPRFSHAQYFLEGTTKGVALADSVLKQTPLKVTVSVSGSYPIDSTAAYSPYPIAAALDDDPYSFLVIESVDYPEIGIPDGNGYRTAAEFDFSASEWEEGLHYLVFRAFDVYGNNALQYVPFSIVAQEKDESISSLKPEWLAAEARTFSVSRQLFSTESQDRTRYISLDFKIDKNKAEAAAVRGFLIYRCDEEGRYECIAKMNHHGLYDSWSYNFTDADATLRFGKTYRYKVRAFVNGSRSRYSDEVAVIPCEPFVLEMQQPTDGAVVSVSPEMSFQVSSSGIGNLFFYYKQFSFSVNIGQVGVSMYEYPLYIFDVIYDCEKDAFFESNGLPYLNDAFSCDLESGTIHIKLAAFSSELLKRGVSYWVYIGNKNSAHGPCFQLSSGISSSIVFGSSAEWGGLMTDSLRVFSVENN